MFEKISQESKPFNADLKILQYLGCIVTGL